MSAQRSPIVALRRKARIFGPPTVPELRLALAARRRDHERAIALLGDHEALLQTARRRVERTAYALALADQDLFEALRVAP